MLLLFKWDPIAKTCLEFQERLNIVLLNSVRTFQKVKTFIFLHVNVCMSPCVYVAMYGHMEARRGLREPWSWTYRLQVRARYYTQVLCFPALSVRTQQECLKLD